jgi:hypothetical protein
MAYKKKFQLKLMLYTSKKELSDQNTMVIYPKGIMALAFFFLALQEIKYFH